MTAFEEWEKRSGYDVYANSDRKIMKIAFNAGMTRAAEICNTLPVRDDDVADECAAAILKARDGIT